MNISIVELYQRLQRQHPQFRLSLVIGLILGSMRAWGNQNWWLTGWSTVLFVAGVFLAQLVFLGDEEIHRTAQQHLPLGETTGTGALSSPLRRGYMLLALPVLATFLISSTRATLGLGFFWGLSAVYWWDLRRYFTDVTSRAPLHQRYFSQFLPDSIWVSGITIGYLIYGLILTIILGWPQGLT